MTPEPFPPGQITGVYFAAAPLYAKLRATDEFQLRHAIIVALAIMLDLPADEQAEFLHYFASMRGSLQ